MADQQEMRKLTAILDADVVAYSRLMGDDDVQTVAMLTRCRRIFSDGIRRHGGRLVNAPGDSILGEFPSVVAAVRCALAVQAAVNTANADLPEHRRMRFRIGVNLGDVIQKGADIFGDGVNLAARLQALAQGGGICISSSVYDQVKQHLDGVSYRYIGEKQVKHIAEPVRVYAVVVDRDGSGDGSDPSPPADAASRAVTIAVLPFENLSDNREHDYFARGVVEDLITDLAHFANLRVISSYSARKIGADAQNQHRLANEFGIGYLLKGNLRRQGGHIRITSQLLDAAADRILWAERYDAPLDTIFEIQDDIVQRVVGAISLQIDKVLLAAARKKPLTSLAAYDCWLRGMDRMWEGTPEADREARRIFKQALAIDPDYSRAHAGLSLSYFNDWSCQLWEDWEETGRQAYRYALKASRLDDTDHIVQMILGRILLYRREFDRAEHHLDRSLALNRNDADSLAQMATSKGFLGRPEEAETLFLKARHLNPYRNVRYSPYGAFVYFLQRRYEDCVRTAAQGPMTGVWVDLAAYVAAAHAHLGHRKEAARYLGVFAEAFTKKITRGRTPGPGEMLDWLTQANPFRDAADTRHLVDGLRAAGLSAGSGIRPVPAGGAPDPPPAAGVPNAFQQNAGVWEIRFDRKTVRLPGLKGFQDLARLLADPGAEVHCTELTGSPNGPIGDDPVIDDKARRAYKARIRELNADIAEAESMNDLARTERLTAELEELTAHLSRALGLGWRTRTLDTAVERARVAVTSRIRSAIRKIDAVHPSLGRHLTHSIRTGTFCSYSPENAVRWEV